MSYESNTYFSFLGDLVSIMKQKLEKSSREVVGSTDESDKLFNQGQLMGYYDLVTTFKSQMIAFDMNPDDLGLADFNPDLYLL